jgi:hypothetical protein
MRRLLAIVNSSAGSADDEVVSRVLAELGEHADTVAARIGDPAELPGALAEHPQRDPVVLGGDGTLHCLVAALAERGELGRRTVGLVPLGTGNDLARTLGVPMDPVEAARVAALGEPRALDLLRDEDGGVVVNAVHLGVGVEAARAAQPLKPVLRRFAYAVGSVIAGARMAGLPLRVEVDGRASGAMGVPPPMDLPLPIPTISTLRRPSAAPPSRPTPGRPTGSPTWSSRSRPARCGGCSTGCCCGSDGTRAGRTWSPCAVGGSGSPARRCP